MDLTYNAETLLRVQDGDLDRAARHHGLSAAAIQDAMDSLRRWYTMKPHLPQGAIEDRKLIRHLTTCGFSIEKTKNNLDSYYRARNIAPEFTGNRDPLSKNVEDVFRVTQIATFPQRTDENHRVTLFRLKEADISLWQAWEAFKVAFMIGDYRLMNDTVVGDHFIIHFTNIRVGHLAQVTPSLVTKSLFYLQSCIGAKIKGIHLVGLPTYAETFVNMFKKALSPKIASRFYTYSNFEDLKKVFSPKVLPKDLGGEDMSTDDIMDNWKRTLQSPAWRRWFIEQERVRTDESKRDNTSPVDSDEILGIHGSFRKLDVD